jgi:hypothetical protein
MNSWKGSSGWRAFPDVAQVGAMDAPAGHEQTMEGRVRGAS